MSDGVWHCPFSHCTHRSIEGSELQFLHMLTHALAHLARHLAAGADNPDAYAARVVQQAVQLPALSALAADHPDATGPELAALYLAGQPASDQPAPRATRCGICGGPGHDIGGACLDPGPGLLEVNR